MTLDPDVTAIVAGVSPVTADPNGLDCGAGNDDFGGWSRWGRRLLDDDVGRGVGLRIVDRSSLMVQAVADGSAGHGTRSGANGCAAERIVAAAVVAHNGASDGTQRGTAHRTLLGVGAGADTARVEAQRQDQQGGEGDFEPKFGS